MGKKQNERKGALARAVEARGRNYYPVEINGFLGLGDKPIQMVEVRVPVKNDEDKSVVAAHSYVKERTSDDPDARTDADILTDAKLLEVLFRSIFEPVAERTAQNSDAPPVHYPAFPGTQWMREHLTSEQAAVLYNVVSGFRCKESPLEQDLDSERVRALALGCVETAKSDLPDVLLARCNREFLVAAFIMLAEQCEPWLRQTATADSDATDHATGD